MRPPKDRDERTFDRSFAAVLVRRKEWASWNGSMPLLCVIFVLPAPPTGSLSEYERAASKRAAVPRQNGVKCDTAITALFHKNAQLSVAVLLAPGPQLVLRQKCEHDPTFRH